MGGLLGLLRRAETDPAVSVPPELDLAEKASHATSSPRHRHIVATSLTSERSLATSSPRHHHVIATSLTSERSFDLAEKILHGIAPNTEALRKPCSSFAALQNSLSLPRPATPRPPRPPHLGPLAPP